MNDEQYDIDSDDNFLAFDPYELGYGYTTLGSSSSPRSRNAANMPLPPDETPNMPQDETESSTVSPAFSRKGKGTALPMPTRTMASIHDIFDGSPREGPAQMVQSPSSSVTPSHYSSFSSSSFAFSSPSSSGSSSYGVRLSTPMTSEGSVSPRSSCMDTATSTSPGDKGKGRSDTPPVLPPLTFSPTNIGDCRMDWISQTSPTSSAASPPAYETPLSLSPPRDSLGPGHASPPINDSLPSNSDQQSPHLTPRRRSLSSLPVSIGSTASKVTASARATPNPPQSYLARKLALGRLSSPPSRPTSPPVNGPSTVPSEVLRYDLINTPGGARVWYVAPKVDANSSLNATPAPSPRDRCEPSPQIFLKHKGRSRSDPLTFSALDYVPLACTDIFEPLPLFVKTYFDEFLPREIHLHILRSFIQTYIDDHQRTIEGGRWSFNRAAASRNQWVGKDRAVRELVKLSRVSKSWRTAVYDGQLWYDFDLQNLSKAPQHFIARVAKAAGPFIRNLNLSGHAHLNSDRLLNIAGNLCTTGSQTTLSFTQLTTLNLQGCSSITTQSLHHLLIRSRALEKVNLKGLGSVTNTTCEILATYCPRLISLNLGRCPNMDADGIYFMAKAVIARRVQMDLKELRLCGLKHISDPMMEALGRATPSLEVLDLSYCRQLHNSAVEAFVACNDGAREYESELGGKTVLVSARDLGRNTSSDSSDGRYRRRVTRLRHLNLSFCLLLTDVACSNLAYSVPRLEILELAGIGSDLKDQGLIRLLERTPLIRKLDFEDATDLTDAFLATITPPPVESTASGRGTATQVTPQPGHALQHLTISYGVELGDDALLSLIRNCTRLTVLEADNTRIGPAVLREFTTLARSRKIKNAKFVGVDCRGISQSVVKELAPSTRPRLGWRSYQARRLHYLDARDVEYSQGAEEDMKVGLGMDECDENRVVLKTFYSWQTVDAVKANREKRRKANGSPRRVSGTSSDAEEESSTPPRGSRIGGTRWWSPGGSSRRSGSSSPLSLPDTPNEGCRTM